MFREEHVTLTDVKWHGEDFVHFAWGDTEWMGSKRKDFWYPDSNWEERIKIGTRMRIWTVQWSMVMGFEIWENGKWVPVWCMANDFQTKAESEKSDKAYSDFIEKEGKKIAKLIDKGKSLLEIDSSIDDGHSGNTYGCALAFGVGMAKNRKNAEKIRKEHNEIYGTKGKGVANPALVTIESK